MVGCLVVCARGDFSVGGCQGVSIQHVAVPTDEEMHGKTYDPKESSCF